MTGKLISSNSVFEKNTAYSRAVADGDYVFVSGTNRLRLLNQTA